MPLGARTVPVRVQLGLDSLLDLGDPIRGRRVGRGYGFILCRPGGVLLLLELYKGGSTDMGRTRTSFLYKGMHTGVKEHMFL